MSPQPPAIVLSAGPQGLAVTRGLGERGVDVFVAHWDADDPASASRYARGTVRMPAPDAGDGAVVERLLEMAAEHAGAVLIPTTDGAVKDVARAKPVLERAGYLVDCPAWEVAERYIDKRYTYELAAELGIPAPRTVVAESPDDLEAYVAAGGEFPCIVKPRQIHLWSERIGGKMTVVRSAAEMRRSFAVAQAAGLDVMIQELIPGTDDQGVNYNAFRTRDGVVAACTARKVRQGPPRFGLPRVVRSVDVPEVHEPGARMLEAMGLEGFACTEFKLDRRDGTFKLIEVNGRHNLSSLLSIRCGVNFPYIGYRYLVAGELPPPQTAQTGLYWIHEWLELSQSRTRAGRDVWGPRELVRPWASRHVGAVFDRDDLGPARLLARQLVSDAARVGARPLRRALAQSRRPGLSK